MTATSVPPASTARPSFEVRAVQHGPALADAIAAAVGAAQDGDGLRPVTVVVPTRAAGVALRRLVAARLGGMAAVRFELLARAAELLAGPALAAAGLRPLRPAVLNEAVRAVLREAPGRFAPVAGHPATARAIARTVHELAAPPAERLAALERTRGREAARLVSAVRRRIPDRYDQHHLLRAAADLIRREPARGDELGALIVVLDRDPGAAAAELLSALALERAVLLHAVLTGDALADASVRNGLDALGCPAPDGLAPPDLRTGATVLSAPDPETEVRAAVRHIAARFDDGAPLHRMALLWTAERPYALLVRDALAAAGLPCNGGPRPRLADTPTGLALRGLLRMTGAGPRTLPREEVVSWVSEAPVRRDAAGQPVDGARWDAVSRRAGVVAGLAQWRTRLERHAALVERRAEDEVRDGGSESLRDAAATEAAHAHALLAFVKELHELLAPPSGGWAAHAIWAANLLEHYVGAPRHDWDEETVGADRRVRALLKGLATLDELGEPVDLAAFRRAVETALEERLPRRGRLGEGLLVGPLADALGHELDLVVAVGLVEGLAPPKVRDDPVLPDRERRGLPGLPLRGELPVTRRRELLAALAAGERTLLCTARSDNRAGRERLPSRWLLEAVGQITGRPVHSEDLLHLREQPWLHWVASSVPGAGEHASGPGELAVTSLRRWRADGLPLTEHPVTGARLARGFAALHDRRQGVFGPWTGHVGPVAGLELGAAPLSPSRLQTWATCPFRSFLERVLHVEELLRPEETLRIDPREWGNLLHRVLERLVAEGELPAPGALWPLVSRELLHTIGEQEAERAEAGGLTGKSLLWKLDRARLHRVLDAFLDADDRLRARDGTAPQAAERAFGFTGDAVTLDLGDGRAVAFRGYVDRVDVAADGALTVLDYKTGATPERYAKGLQAHPVANGQLLQLPVYALAAGQGAPRVRAAYWFLSAQGIHEISWDLDEQGLTTFRAAVGAIADGMERGLYPQRVAMEWTRDRTSCERCAYELVCDRDRERRWPKLRELPLLAGLAALEGGEPEPTDD